MQCKYLKAAALADVRSNEMLGVELEGESILLALCEGKLHAFGAICTHGLGFLEDGWLEGHEVVCPLHAGAFDIRDGSPSRAPCLEPIKSYAVRIDRGDVYLAMEPGTSDEH